MVEPFEPAGDSLPVPSSTRTEIVGTPDLSAAIIICTRNRNDLLERCLRSIGRLNLKPTRVLIIDNAPDANTVPAIAEKYGADYILEPRPGLSRARNCGARACDEDILAYVDDDMVLHPDWLSSILSGFSDGHVAAVTGPFVPLEMENRSNAAIAEQLVHLPRGVTPFRIDRSSAGWFERTSFGGIGDGNFALRRTVFSHWGGFDERLGRGVPLDMGEDHYAFFELVRGGYCLAYLPQAFVFHPTRHYTGEEASALLAQTIAYAGYMALENPRYAPRIAKYFVERAFGKTRKWRNWSDDAQPPAVWRVRPWAALVSAVRILRQCYARNY